MRYLHRTATPKTKKALRDDNISFSSREKVPQAVENYLEGLKAKRDKSSLTVRRNLLGVMNNLDVREDLKYKTKEHAPSPLYHRECNDIKRKIHEFYELYSEPLPSSRTVSRGVQKRILKMPIEEAYVIFKTLHPSIKCSPRSFFRHRPKHVLSHMKAKLRACLCDICENPRLKLKALHTVNALTEIPSVTGLLDLTMCLKEGLFHKRECLQRSCSNCGVESCFSSIITDVKDMINTRVEWWRWEMVLNRHNKPTMDRVKKAGTLQQLLDSLKKEVRIHIQYLLFCVSEKSNKLCT